MTSCEVCGKDSQGFRLCEDCAKLQKIELQNEYKDRPNWYEEEREEDE